MNVFQLSYDVRLKEFSNLKLLAKPLPNLEKYILIDKFWQQAPLITHYLHIADINSWPNPWELLVENTYCMLARALGICYTLHMIEDKNFELVSATDNMGNDVYLVLVNNHMLNYWPDTVETNSIDQFTVKKTIDISRLLAKI